jgi:diguanylate cyclase (GGDEF)-like protein
VGHAAGDRLIVRVAEAIRSQVRQGDHVARIGGDEFVATLSP